MGTWPSTDPWGKSFSPSHHPEWRVRAGRSLANGWRGVFCGLQGDQQWIHETMGLQRGMASTSVKICVLF